MAKDGEKIQKVRGGDVVRTKIEIQTTVGDVRDAS